MIDDNNSDNSNDNTNSSNTEENGAKIDKTTEIANSGENGIQKGGTTDTGTQSQIPSTTDDTINRNDPTQNASHSAAEVKANDAADAKDAVESDKELVKNAEENGEAKPVTAADAGAVAATESDGPVNPLTNDTPADAPEIAQTAEAGAAASTIPEVQTGSKIVVSFTGAHKKSATVVKGSTLQQALKAAGIPYTTHTYRDEKGNELGLTAAINAPLTVNVATKASMG